MTQKQMTPEQHAAQQEEAEESARRESRRKAIAESEVQRRETEAREADKEARREAARQKAEELGARRAELEAQAQEQMNAVNETLDDLRSLDGEHRRELHAAGGVRGPGKYQDLGRVVHEWVQGSLLRDNPSSRARMLEEIDLLTVSGSSENAFQAPGLPGSDPRDEPRREENRFLATLHQRSVQLRRQYARDLAFGELVSPGERDQVDQLSEERREQVQRMLTGENRDER
jgi:hypothetical protein